MAKMLRNTPKVGIKWAGALAISDAPDSWRQHGSLMPALSFSVPHSTGNGILTRAPSPLHGVPQCLSVSASCSARLRTADICSLPESLDAVIPDSQHKGSKAKNKMTFDL